MANCLTAAYSPELQLQLQLSDLLATRGEAAASIRRLESLVRTGKAPPKQAAPSADDTTPAADFTRLPAELQPVLEEMAGDYDPEIMDQFGTMLEDCLSRHRQRSQRRSQPAGGWRAKLAKRTKYETKAYVPGHTY